MELFLRAYASSGKTESNDSCRWIFKSRETFEYPYFATVYHKSFAANYTDFREFKKKSVQISEIRG